MVRNDTIETLRDGNTNTDPSSITPTPQLVVALECDRPAAGAARYCLAGVDEIVVGRGAERGFRRADEGGVRRLRVDVPGACMSSRHARISLASGVWSIEDLGSTNGSFVNGKRIAREALTDTDVIELGRTLFLLRGGMPTPEGADTLVDSPARSARDAGFGTLVPRYSERLQSLAGIATSTLPILLLGESGTGKELLARAIHAKSRRAGKLVAVNCGALPDNLVESQLFGHTRGAFSGAVKDEPGLVRASDGGTLFLDEIGDLRKSSQAALLRVLQEGEVLPVGGTRPVKVDLRIVAATHRPLSALVERGEFRADLYARLTGYIHTLPSLRNRQEDIGDVVAVLLARLAHETPLTLTPEVGRALFLHSWPLNVRELEQCLASSALLAARGVIEKKHLPESVRLSLDPRDRFADDDVSLLELSGADRRVRGELTFALQAQRGNVAAVSRVMGKAPMQIHRWMKRFGIDPARYRT